MKDLISNLPYYSSVKKPGTELENLIQWVLDPTEIIELLEHNLRGEIPGERRGEWIPIGEQMLNDQGVRKMISMVAARVNKIVTMTWFDERHIYDIMFYLAMDIRNDMFINFEKYGIEFHNLTTVSQMIKDFTFAALMQAKDGGARNTWSKIQRVTTSIIEDRSKQKGNWVPSQFAGQQ